MIKERSDEFCGKALMAYAEIRDERTIEVQTIWSERELIKQVPGTRWDHRTKTWTLPLAWASCITLRGVFRDNFNVGPKLTKWSWDIFTDRIDPLMRIRMKIGDPETIYDPLLYDFQNVGVEFLTLAGDALLADEMGTGKTVQGLVALNQLGEEALPALVVSPNSVKKVWANEAAIWAPDANPYVLKGSALQKRKTLAEAAKDPSALVIVNIESVRLLSRLAPFGNVRLTRCAQCDPAKKADERSVKGEKVPITAQQCEMHPKEFNSFGFKTVLIDEAHCIKEPKSKQTRATWAVCHGPTVTRRWAFTGTPIANDPSDLWSIMHAVAPYDYPDGRSKHVDRYCLQSWNNYGGLDVVGVRPDNRDEYFKILDPHFRRMPKRLVLPQLPPKVRQVRYVEMTPKQAKAYREIETNLLTRLDDGTIMIAPSNLEAHTRLLQFSSTYCHVDWVQGQDPEGLIVIGGVHYSMKMNVTLTEPSPKIDELLEVLNDLPGEQVAVCAQSRQLIDLAAARLEKEGISYSIITGAINEHERDFMLREFQAGNRRVMLFTMAAGGVGLTMTAAATIVYLQRSWSMVHNVQSENRVDRIGSEIHDTIRVIDIVAEGTIEETHQIPRLYEKMYRLEEIARDRTTIALNGGDTSYLDEEENRIISSFV